MTSVTINRLLRMLAALSFIGLSVMGCSNDPSRVAQQSAEIIAAATAQPSLAAKYDMLFKQPDVFCRLGGADDVPCSDALSVHERKVGELARQVLLDAIKVGDMDVLASAERRGAFENPQMARTLVDAAAAKDASPWLQFHAARVLAKGAAVPRDSAAAIQYLESAWSKGVMQSARHLAEIMSLQGDKEGAYKWSLRCTNPCERSHAIELNELAVNLPKTRVSAIEREVAQADRGRMQALQ